MNWRDTKEEWKQEWEEGKYVMKPSKQYVSSILRIETFGKIHTYLSTSTYHSFNLVSNAVEHPRKVTPGAYLVKSASNRLHEPLLLIVSEWRENSWFL